VLQKRARRDFCKSVCKIEVRERMHVWMQLVMMESTKLGWDQDSG
jgi:hypothetical protein